MGKIAYRYYILDDGAGEPMEVFRALDTEAPFHQRRFERAKRSGVWSADDAEVNIVLNMYLVGDFDPQADEISEIAAFSYLKKWRTSVWPGRS